MAYIPVLQHHGILGQKWGVKNGPPYPLKGGDYSAEEKKKKYIKSVKSNSSYNKKHFDETLKSKNTTLHTLSLDPERTKDTDFFYATHKVLDNNVYKALLNKPVPKDVFDEDGNKIGTEKVYKFLIKNKISEDIKVASEDSSAKIFADLYKNDRDFFNFVVDENRMQKYFADERFVFKSYRDVRDILNKIRNDESYVPSQSEIQTIYRMFNFVIPYDGRGWSKEGKDWRGGKDVLKQRTKFFKKCSDAGYGAILDTNDSLYNSLHAKSPVIVFDMEKVIPDKVLQTDLSDRVVGIAALSFRKTFGV